MRLVVGPLDLNMRGGRELLSALGTQMTGGDGGPAEHGAVVGFARSGSRGGLFLLDVDRGKSRGSWGSETGRLLSRAARGLAGFDDSVGAWLTSGKLLGRAVVRLTVGLILGALKDLARRHGVRDRGCWWRG